jgi:ECF transporter S component (folate family)
MAMLIALEVVLNRFCSINTQFLKLGFGFVPVVAAAYLFGPVSAAVVYGLADLVGANLFPIGPYHPGFTVCAAMMGAVYGIFLYGKRADTPKIFLCAAAAATVNSVVFGLLLNTWWVSMLYDSRSYLGYLVMRLPEYAVMIPLNVVLIPVILRVCREIEQYVLPKGAVRK